MDTRSFKKFKINYLTFHLNKLGKKTVLKPKQKEIIKIKSDQLNRKLTIIRVKKWFFENIDKID